MAIDDCTESTMPEIPDPFWPAGVIPKHLSPASSREIAIVEAYCGKLSNCEKCGKVVTEGAKYCVDCADRETKNTAMAKKTNSDWMTQSDALGLAIFERQPEESDTEWRIWCAYREFYPRKLPTWTELAKKCECSVATVVAASQRWSFKVRLVAWARFTDGDIQDKRVAAIKEMNESQLSMSKAIMAKLSTAIDCIEPETLRPGEIVNLFKVATELERRITTYVEETVATDIAEAKSKQVSLTKPEDINEVLQILQKTGLLDGRTIGIEQTTRVISKENE